MTRRGAARLGAIDIRLANGAQVRIEDGVDGEALRLAAFDAERSVMLPVAPGVKVYLACQPVDMRRGFDGLSADVARIFAADPYSGAAFVFRGRRGDYVKILTWDGSGCACSPSGWRTAASSGRRSSKALCN